MRIRYNPEARPELAALSSSAVRTLQLFGKDVSRFLP